MELQISLKKMLKKGALTSELDLQRATVADRKLRLLVKDHPELVEDRKQLRAMIKAYEDKHWTSADISEKQIEENDIAEKIAEQERDFIEKRKLAITAGLKVLGLTQKDLGAILGHASATYMSELVNGINPFTLNDLIIINRLLKIKLEVLIPTTINQQLLGKVISNISRLDNPKLKFGIHQFVDAY